MKITKNVGRQRGTVRFKQAEIFSCVSSDIIKFGKKILYSDFEIIYAFQYLK